MKKTIAILLVLVLAGVGLFAANPVTLPTSGNDTSATLTLTTSIAAYNLMAITSTEFEGTTFSEWNTFNATTISNPVTLNSSGIHGYLNVITNSQTGVNVYMKAETLKASSEDNSYEIDYTAKCNGVSVIASSNPTVGTLIIADTVAVSTSSIFMESYAVTATLTADSLENAPEDTYEGNITFTFTAS